ncbi:glucosaminidase domain-containing protein [Olivibacter sp. SDN3]|uniref:glucosaminidase domain and LysM peptidoglycan-binding domain-containing protein n=1 Tax=Olivibacter sp. SDN3 TaxID=2764720 RepID=UPI0016517926|nr:glucosaminidase domain-containing protein [Olivibacter sp. SDN3]QNL50715.1 glucosaminidase domain-containing protein [Olivibacter sp. SDN3]
MKPLIVANILYFFLILVTSSNKLFAQNIAHAYIDNHKDWAISAMREFGIPASIILAVAMHESANGNSKVAVHLNNHFGIKGPNSNTQIKSAYKGYNSVKDSYDDFIAYLKNRKQLSTLFDRYPAYDYQSWAYGIMHGGYAGNKAWAAHIIALIKKHRLFELDDVPEDDIATEFELPKKAFSETPPTIYVVKKGDTLGIIAKRHHTTVKNIIRKNSLVSDRLKIGQRIKI